MRFVKFGIRLRHHFGDTDDMGSQRQSTTSGMDQELEEFEETIGPRAVPVPKL